MENRARSGAEDILARDNGIYKNRVAKRGYVHRDMVGPCGHEPQTSVLQRGRPFRRKGESTLSRIVLGLVGIAGTGLWLLTGANAVSSPQQVTSSSSVQYLEGTASQKERAFSPAVITRGGRIIWLAGQTTTADLNGNSLVGDFQGQAKTDFALIDRTLKRSGGSLQNLVTMTVFINDPRYGDQFVKMRHEMFPDGKFPASALITVSNFAQPGILIEIQGVAVIGE
jgi:2-iminobutanoate/2-iminopropanoate deaminase